MFWVNGAGWYSRQGTDSRIDAGVGHSFLVRIRRNLFMETSPGPVPDSPLAEACRAFRLYFQWRKRFRQADAWLLRL